MHIAALVFVSILVPSGDTDPSPAGATCKRVTVKGRAFYNDQRRYGVFHNRDDEAGATGRQYRLRNADQSTTHTANYLGLLDGTVEIHEVDRFSGNGCYATARVGSTTVNRDGTYSWTGNVCDTCASDDVGGFELSQGGVKGVSIAVKVALSYCPSTSERCFSVHAPGPSPSGDHQNGSTLYTRWHTSLNPTNERRIFQDDLTVAATDLRYEAAASNADDRDAGAANQFASFVDATRRLHEVEGIPFGKSAFGEVVAIYPITWNDGGEIDAAHSHEANGFCVPQNAGQWMRGDMAMHEYGHVVNYRAWQGHGKRVSYNYGGDPGEFNTEEHPAAAFKEPFANFVRGAVLDDVTATESVDFKGCAVETNDDAEPPATGVCTAPTACLGAERNPGTVGKVLCDWLDDRVDTTSYFVGSDYYHGSLYEIWRAVSDAWASAPQSVKNDYIDPLRWAKDGLSICDVLRARAASISGFTYYRFAEMALHDGLDCGL